MISKALEGVAVREGIPHCFLVSNPLEGLKAKPAPTSANVYQVVTMCQGTLELSHQSHPATVRGSYSDECNTHSTEEDTKAQRTAFPRLR